MIDMHAHSTVSDGSYTPRELVRLAKMTGLSAVALTDHNSVEGLAEAEEESNRLGLHFVKGIELTVRFGEGRLLHILGLGIDPYCAGFMVPFVEFRRRGSAHMNKVFAALEARGVDVTREDAVPFVTDGYMNRQAIAKAIIAKGYAGIMKEAWINYLDKIPYHPDELMSPQEAIDTIHAAGGKAIMAHFHMPIGLKGYTDAQCRQHLGELKAMGLDGMEYHYPSFTKEDQMRVASYIEDFDFIKSGGSDFHGTNRAHIKLGVGEGRFRVPDKVLEEILDIKRKRPVSA